VALDQPGEAVAKPRLAAARHHGATQLGQDALELSRQPFVEKGAPGKPWRLSSGDPRRLRTDPLHRIDGQQQDSDATWELSGGDQACPFGRVDHADGPGPHHFPSAHAVDDVDAGMRKDEL
jgi:hypothetical protein